MLSIEIMCPACLIQDLCWIYDRVLAGGRFVGNVRYLEAESVFSVATQTFVTESCTRGPFHIGQVLSPPQTMGLMASAKYGKDPE